MPVCPALAPDHGDLRHRCAEREEAGPKELDEKSCCPYRRRSNVIAVSIDHVRHKDHAIDVGNEPRADLAATPAIRPSPSSRMSRYRSPAMSAPGANQTPPARRLEVRFPPMWTFMDPGPCALPLAYFRMGHCQRCRRTHSRSAVSASHAYSARRAFPPASPAGFLCGK